MWVSPETRQDGQQLSYNLAARAFTSVPTFPTMS
jgi:hypothetical protein